MASIARSDAVGVAQLLTDYGNRIHINSERRAVQILGCSGRIVEHVPMPGVFLVAVDTVLATNYAPIISLRTQTEP